MTYDGRERTATYLFCSWPLSWAFPDYPPFSKLRHSHTGICSRCESSEGLARDAGATGSVALDLMIWVFGTQSKRQLECAMAGSQKKQGPKQMVFAIRMGLV